MLKDNDIPSVEPRNRVIRVIPLEDNHDVTNVMENGYHIVNKQNMSKRSIRKVIARARRNSYTALKFHIKGLMWVDDVTVDTHLKIFSDDYMKYFWSHLATSCTFLRPLSDDDICATPDSICELITPNSTIEPFAGSVRVRMPQSAFYLKEYGDRISCGPEYPGNTVLNAKAADIAQLIVAYDKEVSRCNAVVTKAINECRKEEVAIRIATASAEAVAGAILRKENMQIDAVQVGTHRVKYSVMTINQIHDVNFWASTDEFKPRLLRAIRRLRHKERLCLNNLREGSHIPSSKNKRKSKSIRFSEKSFQVLQDAFRQMRSE